jgi:hypothetical protein
MSQRAILEESEVRNEGSDSEMGDDELREVGQHMIINIMEDLLPLLDRRAIRRIARMVLPYLEQSERNIEVEE